MNSDSSRPDLAPKQTRSVRSRQLVLDAARGLIEDVGIEGLTLAAVAARAGVAVGTVYNRFEDRTHLIEEVVAEWTDQVSAKFAHTDADSSADPRESLKDLVVLFRENRTFIRQILIHAPLIPAIAAKISPWLEMETSHLVTDLRSRESSTRRRADLVASMVLATVERAALDQLDDAQWAVLESELPEAGGELLARPEHPRP